MAYYNTDQYIHGREIVFSPVLFVLAILFWAVIYISVIFFKPDKSYLGYKNYQLALEMQQSQTEMNKHLENIEQSNAKIIEMLCK